MTDGQRTGKHPFCCFSPMAHQRSRLGHFCSFHVSKDSDFGVSDRQLEEKANMFGVCGLNMRSFHFKALSAMLLIIDDDDDADDNDDGDADADADADAAALHLSS